MHGNMNVKLACHLRTKDDRKIVVNPNLCKEGIILSC